MLSKSFRRRSCLIRSLRSNTRYTVQLRARLIGTEFGRRVFRLSPLASNPPLRSQLYRRSCADTRRATRDLHLDTRRSARDARHATLVSHSTLSCPPRGGRVPGHAGREWLPDPPLDTRHPTRDTRHSTLYTERCTPATLDTRYSTLYTLHRKVHSRMGACAGDVGEVCCSGVARCSLGAAP